MSKLAITALIITASVPSFRRAGTTFTDAGQAFPDGYFTDEQLAAIRAEKKLSVREMPADAIPEGIDATLVTAALSAAAADEKTEEKKTTAQAQSAKAKAKDAGGTAATGANA